jgi:hypothetical protein
LRHDPQSTFTFCLCHGTSCRQSHTLNGAGAGNRRYRYRAVSRLRGSGRGCDATHRCDGAGARSMGTRDPSGYPNHTSVTPMNGCAIGSRPLGARLLQLRWRRRNLTRRWTTRLKAASSNCPACSDCVRIVSPFFTSRSGDADIDRADRSKRRVRPSDAAEAGRRNYLTSPFPRAASDPGTQEAYRLHAPRPRDLQPCDGA